MSVIHVAIDLGVLLAAAAHTHDLAIPVLVPHMAGILEREILI
jgi:hypothetical protein